MVMSQISKLALELNPFRSPLDGASDSSYVAGSTLNERAILYSELANTKQMAPSLKEDLDKLLISSETPKAEAIKAKELGEAALERAKKSGDTSGAGHIYLALADVQIAAKEEDWINEAIDVALEALSIFQDGEDKKLAGYANLTVASLYYQRNHGHEVNEFASAALTIFEELEDQLGLAKTYHTLALQYVISQQFSQATKLASDALDIYKKLGDTENEAFEQSALATWYLEQGRPLEASSAALKALSLMRALKVSPGRELNSLGLAVKCLIAKFNAKKAVELAKKTVDHYEEQETEEFNRCLPKAQCILSAAYTANGDTEDAQQAAEEGMDAAKSLSDSSMELACMHQKAAALFEGEEVEGASQVMDEALNFAESEDNKFEIGEAGRVLAKLYLQQQDNMDQALAVAEQAKGAFEEHSKLGEAQASILIGAIRSEQGDTPSALTAVEESVEAYADLGHSMGQATALQVLAMMQIQMEDVDAGLQTATRRKEVWEDLNNHQRAADAMLPIVDLYLSCEEFGTAESMAKEGAGLAKRAGNAKAEAQHNIILTSVYLAQLGREDVKAIDEHHMASHQRDMRDKAFTAVNTAVKLSGIMGDKGLRATSMLLRAQVLTWTFRADNAIKSAKEAEMLFVNLGNKIGEVSSLLLQANLLVMSDDDGKAQELANKAWELGEEMEDDMIKDEAQKILEKIEAKARARAPVMPQMMVVQQEQFDMGAGGAGDSIAMAPKAKGLDMSTTKVKLLELLKNSVTSDDEIEEDTPLMEAGMDSLSSVQFINECAREFAMSLSPSVVFDFPTIAALTNHLVEESMSVV